MHRGWLFSWAVVAVLGMCQARPAGAQPFTDEPTSASPALASYAGGFITLQNLEDFALEQPRTERTPRLVDSATWRAYMCRLLAKDIGLTSQALVAGLHEDP